MRWNIVGASAVFIFSAGILSPLFGTFPEDRSKDISSATEVIVYEKPVQNSLCGQSHTPYERGIASWYGPGFHGKTMANGRTYDMYRYTVAHRTLPLGTEVCVTNQKNGKSVRAVVTDRGPYIAPRIIDLSKRIADELDITESGLGMVAISLHARDRTVHKAR